MTHSTTIEAINTIQPDPNNDLVRIECASGDTITRLELRSGALSNLILGLRQAARAFPTTGDFEGQTLVLTGAGLIALQDGTLALELLLDRTLCVVVDISEDTMTTLYQCLFAMDALRDSDSAGMTAH